MKLIALLIGISLATSVLALTPVTPAPLGATVSQSVAASTKTVTLTWAKIAAKYSIKEVRVYEVTGTPTAPIYTIVAKPKPTTDSVQSYAITNYNGGPKTYVVAAYNGIEGNKSNPVTIPILPAASTLKATITYTLP